MNPCKLDGFLSTAEVTDCLQTMERYFVNAVPQESIEKVFSYIQKALPVVQKKVQPDRPILIKASVVGYEQLPFTLLFTADGKGVDQVLILFNRKSVCRIVEQGACKRVKLALNLREDKRDPWRVTVTIAPEADKDAPAILRNGYRNLLELQSERGVLSVRSPLLETVSHHPGKRKKFTYVATLYGKGDLIEYFNNKGTFTKRQMKSCALSLLRTMCSVHGRGFVHSDLKPDNILVSHLTSTAKGNPPFVAITDFDAALGGIDKKTWYDPLLLSGTVGFFPPERIEYYCLKSEGKPTPLLRGDILLRGDVFSFGLVLAYLYHSTFTVKSSGLQIVMEDLISKWQNIEKEELSTILNDVCSAGKSCCDSDHWLSEEGLAFPETIIWQMLHPNPYKRWSFEQVVEAWQREVRTEEQIEDAP